MVLAVERWQSHIRELEALLGQEMGALSRTFEEEYARAKVAEKNAKDAARKEGRYFVWSSVLSGVLV